jgi:hypothetical protein
LNREPGHPDEDDEDDEYGRYGVDINDTILLGVGWKGIILFFFAHHAS